MDTTTDLYQDVTESISTTEMYFSTETETALFSDEATTSVFEDLTTVAISIANSTSVQLKEVGKLEFSIFDYILFALMLGLSALIGVYFAFCGKTKQDNTTEYLLGGKVMGVFPIAMSLVASHVSGITLLGVPSDVYTNGCSYWLIIISILIVAGIVCAFYLPVFYHLQLTSVYEYLEKRFDSAVRKTASFLFALSMILYIPIVIYIPALAFSAVTGIGIHFITPITCFVCIFYTTLGGLKAVVWTDTLQMICMIGSMFAVLYLGTSSAGGFAAIWERARVGDRLEFDNFNLDPTDRTSFWSVVIGASFAWTSYVGANQGCIQRFLAVPTMTKARSTMVLMAVGIVIVKSVSAFTGLIMYAKYADCDPITLHKVDRADQLLPYYVIDVAGHIPGLPGLFVAGVFSAALSTMSATLNTLAGTIYEDFIKPLMPKNTTEKRASDIMKLLVVISGALCVFLVFVVERLGGVLQLGISLSGITAGPLLGLFSIGLFSSTANSKGAMYGGLASLAIMIWIVGGAQFSMLNGSYKRPTKPLSIDGCDFNTTLYANVTSAPTVISEEALPFVLYRISFYYYTLVGTVCTFLIGLPVSWLTGGRQQFVDRDLLSPITKLYTSRTNKQDYTSVETALQIVKLNSEK